MKKLLTIMLILFVGFAAFAQDSVVVVVPEDSAPSQDDSMFYLGVELGAGSINDLVMGTGAGTLVPISPMVGFEMSPVIGFRPFADSHLALELNVMMDWLYYTAFNAGIESTDITYMTTVISPQFLCVYTFGSNYIRPFAGMGLGVNFNNLEVSTKEKNTSDEWETVKESINIDPSFSLVLKSGVKLSIPDTNFDIYGLCRYNVNMPSKFKVDETTTKMQLNASNLSIALGAVYNF